MARSCNWTRAVPWLVGNGGASSLFSTPASRHVTLPPPPLAHFVSLPAPREPRASPGFCSVSFDAFQQGSLRLGAKCFCARFPNSLQRWHFSTLFCSLKLCGATSSHVSPESLVSIQRQNKSTSLCASKYPVTLLSASTDLGPLGSLNILFRKFRKIKVIYIRK